MTVGWMRSVQDMRDFISTHALPGAQQREWESDEDECGTLMCDACEWYRIEQLPSHNVFGPRFQVIAYVTGGHWSMAVSTSVCLASCIALCRATVIRLTAEERRRVA